jgi:hypothetical protein
VSALQTAAQQFTSPMSAISLHHLHGRAARILPMETAFATRSEHFMVEIIGQWTDDAPDRHRTWVNDTDSALRPLSLPGGYLNLIGPDEPDRAADAYGPNASRLMDIKRKFDPDGMFTATPLPAGPIPKQRL